MGVYVFLHVCNFLFVSGLQPVFEHHLQSTALEAALRFWAIARSGHPGKSRRAHKSGLFIAQPGLSFGDDREVGIVAVRCEAGVSPRRLPCGGRGCRHTAARADFRSVHEREDPETVKVAALGLWAAIATDDSGSPARSCSS